MRKFIKQLSPTTHDDILLMKDGDNPVFTFNDKLSKKESLGPAWNLASNEYFLIHAVNELLTRNNMEQMNQDEIEYILDPVGKTLNAEDEPIDNILIRAGVLKKSEYGTQNFNVILGNLLAGNKLPTIDGNPAIKVVIDLDVSGLPIDIKIHTT